MYLASKTTDGTIVSTYLQRKVLPYTSCIRFFDGKLYSPVTIEFLLSRLAHCVRLLNKQFSWVVGLFRFLSKTRSDFGKQKSLIYDNKLERKSDIIFLIYNSLFLAPMINCLSRTSYAIPPHFLKVARNFYKTLGIKIR